MQTIISNVIKILKQYDICDILLIYSISRSSDGSDDYYNFKVGLK